MEYPRTTWRDHDGAAETTPATTSLQVERMSLCFGVHGEATASCCESISATKDYSQLNSPAPNLASLAANLEN